MKTLNEIMEQERANRIELFKDIFSARLKEIREERQLSQKAVSNKLGCAVSTYANWEQGRTEPSIYYNKAPIGFSLCSKPLPSRGEPSIYDIFNLMWVYEIEANELFNIDSIV